MKRLGLSGSGSPLFEGRARHYNNRVPQTTPGAIIACGFAVQLLSVVAAYPYVTAASASAAFIWIPAAIGSLVTLVGVVIWCNPRRLVLAAIGLAAVAAPA